MKKFSEGRRPVRKPAGERAPSKFRKEVRGTGTSYITCLGNTLLGSGGKTLWRVHHEKPKVFQWTDQELWFTVQYPVFWSGDMVLYWRGVPLDSGPGKVRLFIGVPTTTVCFRRALPSRDESLLSFSYTTARIPIDPVYHGPKLSDQPQRVVEEQKTDEDLSALRQMILEERS